VVDAARSGAHLSHPSVLLRALGFDIREQLRPGPWDWVALTGGGNDLVGLCGTPEAASARDALIGPDLDGEIPALIARLRMSRTRVAFVGYYDAARAAPTAFTPCQPEFDAMNARLARLAASDPGLVFVDAGDVIDPSDLSLYDPDRIHPSPDGSLRIAAALARAIRMAER
jgi:lysophospholipase L1-like esterase